MLTDAQREQLKPLVRTMQIIVGALALGILIFLTVVCCDRVQRSARGRPIEPFLTYIAAGSAVFAVVASIFVPHDPGGADAAIVARCVRWFIGHERRSGREARMFGRWRRCIKRS